jgi:hypothetical protein
MEKRKQRQQRKHSVSLWFHSAFFLTAAFISKSSAHRSSLIPCFFTMTTPEHHNTSPREEKSIPHDIPPDSEMLAGGRSSPKSRAFYMSFVAIGVTTFLSALDLTVMGTALPTIATALHDTKGDFTWVRSSCYSSAEIIFLSRLVLPTHCPVRHSFL